ncbi:MAG: ECF-type sigma factor [Gemmataceae bacterium]|nr:ECF-type sigma factor [Gemmataceae bacterium]
MNEVRRLIERIELGGTHAADELVPIVYEQLRRLAHSQLAKESPGQSLQTVDLVHEAYLRLVGSDQDWHGKGHFLAAAAEAMRRILVERARRKSRIKYGGRYARVELSDAAARSQASPEEVIAVSELLDALEKQHPQEAQIVKLHYFAGLSISEAGRALGLPRSTAHRHWTFARAWLHEAMREQDGETPTT